MTKPPPCDGVHGWALGFWALHAATVLAGVLWLVVSPPALSAEDEAALVTLCGVGSALVLVLWPLRVARWWTSARTPATRVDARLATSVLGRVDAIWVEFLGNTAGAHHQRVIWQPWLRDLPGRLSVRLHRRAGWLGGAVIEVPGFGTLWPAAVLRRREPRFFFLTEWKPPKRPRGRVFTVTAIALVTTMVVAPFAADLASFVWLWSWMFSAVGSLWLWQSGAPLRW